MSAFSNLPRSARLRAAAQRLQAALKLLPGFRQRPGQIQDALAEIRHEGCESTRRHERYISLLAGEERMEEALPEWARSLLRSLDATDLKISFSLIRNAFGITQDAAALLVEEMATEALFGLKGMHADAGLFLTPPARAPRVEDTNRPQLSFEQWSALVDLENAFHALADSQAVMRAFSPTLPAPGAVRDSTRAHSIGGLR